MKKVLFLLLASFLVLAACGNEESKTEDKKETKSSDKEINKDDKKSDDDKEKSKDKEDDKSNEEVETQDETIEQPVQKSSKNQKKEYVKTVKSYQGQIQIIGDDLIKLSDEIDANNQLTPQGESLLTSINNQLDTATNTINEESLEIPKQFEQDHDDLIYADELINEGIQGTTNGDDGAIDNMEVGVSIADDTIKNIIR